LLNLEEVGFGFLPADEYKLLDLSELMAASSSE
jgi:hypothetical protein